MIKKLRKRIRPMWRSAMVAFLWANRRDVARWARFAKRASVPNTRPSSQDLKLEAKVRASLSTDPLLRQDPSIRDIRVRDGIVVLESPADWHNKGLAVTRLSQVKGVESVHTAADVNEAHFLDVDVIEIPVAHAAR
jgi:osmotically-inducible protein OsmY